MNLVEEFLARAAVDASPLRFLAQSRGRGAGEPAAELAQCAAVVQRLAVGADMLGQRLLAGHCACGGCGRVCRDLSGDRHETGAEHSEGGGRGAGLQQLEVPLARHEEVHLAPRRTFGRGEAEDVLGTEQAVDQLPFAGQNGGAEAAHLGSLERNARLALELCCRAAEAKCLERLQHQAHDLLRRDGRELFSSRSPSSCRDSYRSVSLGERAAAYAVDRALLRALARACRQVLRHERGGGLWLRHEGLVVAGGRVACHAQALPLPRRRLLALLAHSCSPGASRGRRPRFRPSEPACGCLAPSSPWCASAVPALAHCSAPAAIA
mmetsp:Transcript_21858/g.85618  ORF Transcript_21858/g.85618 Transcript_21858/m.85618 type:complete len:323 (+) Transcript_21858:3303-4271(+)